MSGLSRRLLPAALAAAALLVTGCGADAPSDSAASVLYSDPAKRPDAPELSGEDLSGTRLSGSEFDGDVVVVNFWASWCAPCRREGPALVEASEATKDQGVRFLGVNIRDDEDKAAAFEKGLGVEYPSIFDPSGRLALAFTDVPPNTIPATIIIDASGKVAAVFREELTAKTLTDAIHDVTAE
jgi:thiol-disulfide isomerase/thioredoxin